MPESSDRRVQLLKCEVLSMLFLTAIALSVLGLHTYVLRQNVHADSHNVSNFRLVLELFELCSFV